MKPEDEVAAMRALHRQASSRIDAAPDPSVRAAVLGTAARAVDAKPRSSDATVAAPFSRRRWPVSMAALLVVSLMTGLVVNQAMRDEPDRVTSAAAPPAAALPAPSPSPDHGGMTIAVARPEPTAPDARSTSAVGKRERPRADHGHALDGFTRDAAQRPPVDEATSAAKIVATPLPPAAPVPPAAPAAAPPAVPAPSNKARAAAPSMAESVADEAPTVVRASPASNTAQRMRRGPEPLTPEAWVERIVKLREAGDGAAADREVDALHARYPDFEIPAAALGATGTR